MKDLVTVLVTHCCDRLSARIFDGFWIHLVTSFVTGLEKNCEAGVADMYVALERLLSCYEVAMWLLCGCYVVNRVLSGLTSLFSIP